MEWGIPLQVLEFLEELLGRNIDPTEINQVLGGGASPDICGDWGGVMGACLGWFPNRMVDKRNEQDIGWSFFCFDH
jgi:hypothetical protein